MAALNRPRRQKPRQPSKPPPLQPKPRPLRPRRQRQPRLPKPRPPVVTVRQVRWFVGLGAGSDSGTFDAQTAFVERFNASQDGVELVLEIVDNAQAQNTLATQIAAGNAPCIAGPVGIAGRDSFKGAWLDVQPLIDAEGYDLSDFDPALVKFYQVPDEGQLGLPFAIYPSMMLYNADLFDEAGLPYPPAEYGMPYIDENGNELEWNVDTLTELAKKLTVDANGNDATMPEFDKENIVQFGFNNQDTDARGMGTFFGAGSFVDADGNAQIPAQWVEAWKWRYDAMWGDTPFTPNGPYAGADFLQPSFFASGNGAMILNHLWYVAPWALGGVTFDWNLAATPSYNGVTTAKMHADTFGILKGCAHARCGLDSAEVHDQRRTRQRTADHLRWYAGPSLPAGCLLPDPERDQLPEQERHQLGRGCGEHVLRRQPQPRELDAQLPGVKRSLQPVLEPDDSRKVTWIWTPRLRHCR